MISINKYGWTPLHAACYFGRLHIVKYLIEELGSDPSASNLNGWHALIFTVMGGSETEASIIQYLIRTGRSIPDKKDSSENTALTYARSIQ